MNKIFIIHGPNLHMLGKRETSIYGTISLPEINKKLQLLADKVGNINLEIKQFNGEGEIVTAITNCDADILILNPAAYTHTSIAIRDAILARKIPVIEVHLSNIYSREKFRQKSFISDIAIGTITGFGELSYYLAFQAAVDYLNQQE